MLNAPAELSYNLDGVYLSDINGDGATDVLQVRFREIDVYFNQAGESFTDRVTASSPAAPGFSPNVRLADIDGTGTVDVVYANASRWKYVDLAGGQRARLLTAVHNGLGASTHLTYGSSTDDYLADLTDADSDPGGEVFGWSKLQGGCDRVLSTSTLPGASAERSGDCVYRSGHSPVISTVVRSVLTDDHFDALGRERNVTETRFAYHDGYYEGIEQEFRGFGAADAVALGDEHQATALTRTHFRQGRRPTEIASDRLADNPREALKGRQWLSEVFDEEGTFLSSSLATLRIRHLMEGLDGRGIYYAYVSQSDELTYGTFEGMWGGVNLDLPAVETESVDPATGVATAATTVEQRTVAVRMADYAHLRSTTDSVDNLGQVLLQTAHGRVGAGGAPIDQAIRTHTSPALVSEAAWIWRTASSYIDDDSELCAFESCQYGLTYNTYNTRGDLVLVAQVAERPSTVPAYEFSGDSFGAESFGITPATETLRASTLYDAWGSAVATCAGADLSVSSVGACGRYASVAYDTDYAQLPERESAAIGTLTASYCDGGATGASAFCMVSSTATWDRGSGALLTVTDPNGRVSAVSYDGLGRMTAVHPPALAADCAVPTHTFRYDLVPAGEPVSVVESYQHVNCSGGVVQARSYVDGLGRPRASLHRMALSIGGGAGNHWEKTAVPSFSARGTPYIAFNSTTAASDPPTLEHAVSLPGTPAVTQAMDAFGRPVSVTERDQSIRQMRYYALETWSFDALDTGAVGGSGGALLYVDTPTIARVDGHGRAVDQVLINATPDAPDHAYYRLFTTYRSDGAVLSVRRAQTGDLGAGDVQAVDGRELIRTFSYDTLGRRIGTTDPDSDNALAAANQSGWRYLFNSLGDLIAVRDARGCGQNFYYDLAGRLVAEDYVECGESEEVGDTGSADLDTGHFARLGSAPSASVSPDVRYYFDEEPAHASELSAAPSGADWVGRLSGSVDRGQRTVVDYDARGRPVWSARQMAVLPAALPAVTLLTGSEPSVADGTPTSTPPARGTRLYDPVSYVSASGYDRIDRPSTVTLPADPDFGSMPPVVGGRITYYERGLPANTYVSIDGIDHPVTRSFYNVNRQVTRTVLAGAAAGQGVADIYHYYDNRLRPTRSRFLRKPQYVDQTPGSTSVNAFYVPFDDVFSWDAADNLVSVTDYGFHYEFQSTDFDPSQRARQSLITHDALYRVIGVDYQYRTAYGNAWNASPGPATDWRAEQAHHQSADPMRRKPAPMVSTLPAERPVSFTYAYDWLANMTEWTDDASAFYERSLGGGGSGGGGILNGHEAGARPGALYFASNIDSSLGGGTVDPAIDRGGYVTLEYGVGGNVRSMTVRGQCHDTGGSGSGGSGSGGSGSGVLCEDPGGLDPDDRRDELTTDCSCDVEQHYQYRWDELNRLSEARRYDRGQTLTNWQLQVRQRYRYDGANVRMVKETRDGMAIGMSEDGTDGLDRTALYIYPGDFERRGLANDGSAYLGENTYGVETQYLVAGTRLVYKNGAIPGAGGSGFSKEARLTLAIPNLIQSTTAVLDLFSGQLLERGTYHPNGARETLRTERSEGFPLEPAGFTGKEGDDEVGLVYFGERYLMPHLGRWATPDPLQVHAGGGGEFGNSYHYVAGNLLQGRDPFGFGDETAPERNSSQENGVTVVRTNTRPAGAEADGQPAQRWAVSPSSSRGDQALDTNEALSDHARQHHLVVFEYDPEAELSFEDAKAWVAIGGPQVEAAIYDADLGASLDALVNQAKGMNTLERATEHTARGASAAITGTFVAGSIGVFVTELVATASESASGGSPAEEAVERLSNVRGSVGSPGGARPPRSGASEPRSRLPRYDGAKPTYHVNPAHVPGRGLRRGKTPLPHDAEQVFSNAVPDSPTEPSAWYGRNAEGQVYRFSLGNDGTAHFTGIRGVGSGTRNITQYAIDRLDGLMSIISGNKKRFAIEAQVEEIVDGWVLGYFRFWAEGEEIGDWTDSADLLGCLRWLQDFADRPRDRFDSTLTAQSAEQVFRTAFDVEKPSFWAVPRPSTPFGRIPQSVARFHISHIGMSSFEDFGLLLLKDHRGHERLIWAYNKSPKIRELFLHPLEMEHIALDFCAQLRNHLRQYTLT